MKDAREMARHIAFVMGDSCAAARALEEADARVKAGEPDIGIWLIDRTWIVGPHPTDAADGGEAGRP